MKPDFSHPMNVYFVGIGGVSMSGLARILKSRGFKVSGSDRTASPVTDELESYGIKVFVPQQAENITDDIDAAVLTSAIHEDNPEYIALKEKGIPMVSRADLLGSIMAGYRYSVGISGTHGKTTTTSMLTQILMDAGKDPTISVGGQLPVIGGNVRIGGSEFFAAEACEYTDSFLSLYPYVGIIMNIEEDHLDYFKDIDDIRGSFAEYASHIPADGYLVINSAIPDLNGITQGLACRVVTFGYDEGDDFRIMEESKENGLYSFTLQVAGTQAAGIRTADGSDLRGAYRISLAVPGRHNVLDASAAFAAACLMGIDPETAADAISHFCGADRRFQKMGSFSGIEVIDDYAHHPTEIRATLRAAADVAKGRVFCVFQPHTYSRTKSLMDDFADALTGADIVVLADIYAARETDDLGISSQTLQDRVRALGGNCEYFASFEEIENYLRKNCQKDDLLITMGAGNVNRIAKDLVSG